MMAENSGQRPPCYTAEKERCDTFRPVGSHTPEVSIRSRDAVFLQAAGLTEVMMARRFAKTTAGEKKPTRYSSPLICHLHLFANKGLLKPYDLLSILESTPPPTPHPHHRAGDSQALKAQPWKKEVRQASWGNVMEGDNHSAYQPHFAISISRQPCHSAHGTPALCRSR